LLHPSPRTLVLKVRESGRVVNLHALLATGVNGDGHREILGCCRSKVTRHRVGGPCAVRWGATAAV